jgi:16S rRNA (guanine966-N2)-methyltransferase
MRVIGGTFGGRRLKAVEGHVTRPTSDRVREALFSRIEARYGLSGSTILDVFSGTGALAIEAVSRGAYRATCIELERRALDTLRANVRGLELTEQVRVIGDDYRKVLARMASTPTASGRKRRFHGVFVDPPYGKNLAVEALEALATLDLVRPGGWVSVEVGRRESLPENVGGSRSMLRRVREDVYGDTKLALYEAPGSPISENQPAGEPGAPAAEVDR